MSSQGEQTPAEAGSSGADSGTAERSDETPLLEVRELRTHFPVTTGIISSITLNRGGRFPLRLDDSTVKAVDGVNFTIRTGETLGVVGESGCGKSTLARTILGLEDRTSGEILFDGVPVDELDNATFRSRSQMVFQDPTSSLNPRRKVGHIIEDPLEGTGWPTTDPTVSAVAEVRTEELTGYTVDVTLDQDVDLVVGEIDGVARVPVTVRRGDGSDSDRRDRDLADEIRVDCPWGLDADVMVDDDRVQVRLSVSATKKELRRERAMELLEQVGLEREYYNRYPHEFSGGQQQRINLARALSINPDLVVADEPVSGLDVSVQAQILNLMKELQDEFDLTYLIISHNLSVIRYMADDVAVMYLGEFVEVAPGDRLFTRQYHPYSRALLGGVPNPNPDKPGVRAQISGNVPSASNPPRACRFHTRCPEFILPEGFSKAGYEAYAALLDTIRAKDVTGFSGSPDEILAEQLPGDGEIPPAARRAARDGVEAALDGDWERAASLLAEHESICQHKSPPLESVGKPDHTAACHLPFEEERRNPPAD